MGKLDLGGVPSCVKNPSFMGLDLKLLSLILGDVGSKALTLFGLILLARGLGDAGFGQVSWAMAIIAYAMIPADSGIAMFGTREIAKLPGTLQWYTKTMLPLRFLLGSSAFVITVAIGYLFIKDSQVWWVLLASAAWLLPYTLNLEWAVRGLQRVELVGLGRFLTGVSFLAAVFVWRKYSGSIAQAALIRALAEIVAVGWSLAIVLWLTRSISKPALGLGWVKSWRASAPLMLATIFTSLYASNFDIFLLGIYHPSEHVGWYSAAYRLYLILAVLPKLFLVLYYPRFANAYMENGDRLQADFQQFLTLSIVYSLPVVSVIFVLAPDIVVLLFGPQYTPAVGLLKILSLGAVPLILAAGLPHMLIATQHVREALACFASGMVLNVVLNLITIPIWGEKAAALNTVISETSILVFGILYVRRKLKVVLPSLRGLIAHFLPAISVIAGAVIARSILLRQDITQALQVFVVAGTSSMIVWALTTSWLMHHLKKVDGLGESE